MIVVKTTGGKTSEKIINCIISTIYSMFRLMGFFQTTEQSSEQENQIATPVPDTEQN